MRIIILYVFSSIVSFTAMAQTKTVQGIVYGLNNLPLQGASVWAKQKNVYTVTNSSGSFKTEALLTDTLIVTFTGYTSFTIPLNNQQQPLRIQLIAETALLGEVVVNTGFQQTARERLTGSFGRVNNEVFNQQQGATVLSRLEGVAGAVAFDKNSNRPAITIRGLSTINGFKDPLIILDNFPYEGDINNLNPNDIETVTILKDAAAASVWGTRAGNGVIVITSKTAKYNQPFKISFNSNWGISSTTRLMDYPVMGSSDYIDVEQLLFSKNFYAAQENNVNKPALTPVVETLIKQRNGLINAGTATEQIDALRGNDIRREYLQHFYQPAARQQYALNIKGGSAYANWMISGGLDKGTSETAVPSTRYNVQTTANLKLFKNAELHIGLQYTQNASAQGKPNYNSIMVNGKTVPYLRFANDAGEPLAVDRTLRSGYTDTAGAGKLLNWKYYPLTDYQFTNTENTSRHLLTDLGLQYNISKQLNVQLKYRNEYQFAETQVVSGAESFAARDMINRYSQLNRNTGVVKYGVPLGSILRMNNNTLKAINARAQVNYNAAWQQHQLNVLAGWEIRTANNKGFSITHYGYNRETGFLGATDYLNAYPTFITGAGAQISGAPAMSDKTVRFVSVFGNLSYTLHNKYSLSGSIRRDASNMFGVNTNDKWNALWSVGAAWLLSSEKWFKWPALSMLRIKSTYGLSGNVDYNKSALTTISAFPFGAPVTGLPFANVFQYGNPDLRWEQSAMMNTAIEFETANKKLSGSIEWYSKRGRDLMGIAPVDITTGLGTNVLTRNVASMKGNGIDAELNYTVLQRKAFKWQQTAFISYNTNKVSDYYLSTNQASFYINDGNVVAPLPGQPVYSIVAYKWAGLNAQTGDPQGYFNGAVTTNYSNITGVNTTIQDLAYRGSATPQWFGSLRNSVQYRQWSLAVNLNYKLGYSFVRPSVSYTSLFNNGTGHKDYASRWQKPSDEAVTTVPSLVYPAVGLRDNFYTASEVLVERGDHIRLQYINVAYTFEPKSKKQLFQRIRCYLTVGNIGILWRANRLNIDPDYPAAIPDVTTYAGGLQIDL